MPATASRNVPKPSSRIIRCTTCGARSSAFPAIPDQTGGSTIISLTDSGSFNDFRHLPFLSPTSFRQLQPVVSLPTISAAGDAASDHRFHRQRAVALAREVAPLDEPKHSRLGEIANLGILFDCLNAASAALPFDNRLQIGPGDRLCLFSYADGRGWIATV